MKTISLALVTALVGFTAAAAKADSPRVSVGIGVTYGPVYTAPAPVYVPAPVVEYRSPAPGYGRGYSPARGRWETVTTKTWIPGRWVMSRDRWGRPHRYFEEGRFAFRTERVWVEHNRRFDHHDYRDNRGGWNR